MLVDDSSKIAQEGASASRKACQNRPSSQGTAVLLLYKKGNPQIDIEMQTIRQQVNSQGRALQCRRDEQNMSTPLNPTEKVWKQTKKSFNTPQLHIFNKNTLNK